jgi:hypothetical protein
MALIPVLSDLFFDARHLKYFSRINFVEATAAEWVQEVKDTPYHHGALSLKIDVAVKRILNGACAHQNNAFCPFIYVRSAGRMLAGIDPPLKYSFDKCIAENAVCRMQVILNPKNINKARFHNFIPHGSSCST